jgi:hypothetical protein
MSKVLRGSEKRQSLFEVGEVVVSTEYGRGVVREVDGSGYLKIIFETDEHNWCAWWFTPHTVTKLQDMEKIKKGGV